MAHIGPIRVPCTPNIATLADRLLRLETAESPDQGVMDAVAEAELELMDALAAARATSSGDLARKLEVLLRRSDAADGILDDVARALLRSVLRDTRRLEPSAHGRAA